MGIFIDRESIERKIDEFVRNFSTYYKELADQKCPALARKLPFFKQGVRVCVVYGKKIFLILSRDSKHPPYSILNMSLMSTWDETEIPQLSKADCIDDIVKILELEPVLYFLELDSLEPEYLDGVLGREASKKLAGVLLEENINTLEPTLEDACDRMKEAYEILFILENKLRRLIEEKLKQELGNEQWWLKGVTRSAQSKYERRKKDPRRRWHLLEDVCPLDFLDFDDLHDIIVNKNSKLFCKYVSPISRFSANMQSLEIPRNMIAHNVVLSSDEYYEFRRTVESLRRIIESNLT